MNTKFKVYESLQAIRARQDLTHKEMLVHGTLMGHSDSLPLR